MAYRVNADLGDIRFYGPTLGSPLDPSTPPAKANMSTYGSGEWTRVLIDATQSWEFETSAGVGWPPLPGHQQDRSRPGTRIAARWDEYGIGIPYLDDERRELLTMEQLSKRLPDV